MSETPPIFEESEEEFTLNDVNNVHLSLSVKDSEPQTPLNSHTFVVKRARSQNTYGTDIKQSAKKQKFDEDEMDIEEPEEPEETEVDYPGDQEVESEKEDEFSEPEDLMRFRKQRQKLRKVMDELTEIK